MEQWKKKKSDFKKRGFQPNLFSGFENKKILLKTFSQNERKTHTHTKQ